MSHVFISYRRSDSRKDAGRLYDRLSETFGESSIFKDVDDMPPGADFRQVLNAAVDRCDVLLVVIGSNWLNTQDEQGNRRLDQSGDFVRLEIETALANRRTVVIPVLVDNAPMPNERELPPSLRELAYKHAVVVRDDPDFHHDATRLISYLKQIPSTSRKTLQRRRWLVSSVLGVALIVLALASVSVVSTYLQQNGNSAYPSPTHRALYEIRQTLTPQFVLTSETPPLALVSVAVDTWTGFRASEFCPDNLAIGRFVMTDAPTLQWLNTEEGRIYAETLGFPRAVVSPPTVYCDANTQSPSAYISSPSGGARVQGRVSVVGSASGENFERYQLELAPATTPDMFTIISAPSILPITDDVLGLWDTIVIPNGLYILRLALFSNVGGYVYRSVQVSVDNPFPTTPS